MSRSARVAGWQLCALAIQFRQVRREVVYTVREHLCFNPLAYENDQLSRAVVLLLVEMPSRKAKIPKTNDPPVQSPVSDVHNVAVEGLPQYGVNELSVPAAALLVPSDAAALLVPSENPFFNAFQDVSSSSSPSTDRSVGHFFDNPATAATTAVMDTEADVESDCVIQCETFTCCGGTWSVGTGFEACKRRPATLTVRHHPRGIVCTVHHDFVKCQSCRLHVHVGCYVLQASAYKQIHRDFVFTCDKCTLNLQVDVKPRVKSYSTAQLDPQPQLDAAAEVAEGKKPTRETICMFTNRKHLMQYARDHGWKCRSSGTNRCYFVCQKDCSLAFCAKAHSTDGYEDNGEWRAINMPEQHGCCKSVMQTVLTTRVCHLPRDAFQEIQRLACCKAFNSHSIQQYIKMSYQLTVDVPLIYNIGYRARNKLGIGDYTLLLHQQAVRVYT